MTTLPSFFAASTSASQSLVLAAPGAVCGAVPAAGAAVAAPEAGFAGAAVGWAGAAAELHAAASRPEEAAPSISMKSRRVQFRVINVSLDCRRSLRHALVAESSCQECQPQT